MDEQESDEKNTGRCKRVSDCIAGYSSNEPQG